MNYVCLPFPTSLYNRIVLQSEGKVDPTRLVADLVENYMESNGKDLKGLISVEEARPIDRQYGDPGRAHLWGSLKLPNGTELRMRYKHKTHYGRIVHEQVEWEDGIYNSVSQWVRAVAENTSRNAWHDVWVKRPGDQDFIYSDALRRDS
ncbi:hypothetical protein [Devosia sp. XK-2]|uniref:hypothetical protein n=1 Tax=Devosia sp. XK-2 TaxID=3126689 RepID=UPI0030D5D346